MLGLKIPHDALVLVGDGEKVILLRNEGDELFPNLQIEDSFAQRNPPTHSQGSDRPGRVTAAAGAVRRSAVENTDWHRLAKEHFAQTIADRLHQYALEERFKHLIIVAPPATLGVLRHQFQHDVKSRVIAEVDKTLTKHPINEIEKILTGSA